MDDLAVFDGIEVDPRVRIDEIDLCEGAGSGDGPCVVEGSPAVMGEGRGSGAESSEEEKSCAYHAPLYTVAPGVR
jgi:hypothetical protein